MKQTILLFLLAILVALNIRLHSSAKPQIDKQLLPYVNTFLDYCDYYHKDCDRTYKFSIKLVTMTDYTKLYKLLGIGNGGNVIGHCWNKSNEIEINIEYFKKASKSEIEQLVFHELGHCVLKLDHTKEEHVSVMNPYSLDGYVYLRHYNKLINELFSCNDSCPQVQFKEEQY